jgi:hypothetical protein
VGRNAFVMPISGSQNCKLFRDPDGQNSFREIKCVSLNEEITIEKNFGMIHKYYRINDSRNTFV